MPPPAGQPAGMCALLWQQSPERAAPLRLHRCRLAPPPAMRTWSRQRLSACNRGRRRPVGQQAVSQQFPGKEGGRVEVGRAGRPRRWVHAVSDLCPAGNSLGTELPRPAGASPGCIVRCSGGACLLRCRALLLAFLPLPPICTLVSGWVGRGTVGACQAQAAQPYRQPSSGATPSAPSPPLCPVHAVPCHSAHHPPPCPYACWPSSSCSFPQAANAPPARLPPRASLCARACGISLAWRQLRPARAPRRCLLPERQRRRGPAVGQPQGVWRVYPVGWWCASGQSRQLRMRVPASPGTPRGTLAGCSSAAAARRARLMAARASLSSKRRCDIVEQ